MRAALLRETATALAAAPLAAAVHPKLKPLMAAYQAAADDESRYFALVFATLRTPGLRPFIDANIGRETPLDEIDGYRDNWWCSADLEEPRSGSPPGPAPFLSAQERAVAQAEVTRLSAIGLAPNYLSLQVLDFAARHPDDPRVPEALHLAVRSTRFGCTNDDTTRLSRRAFTLLHQKYPKSEWTKKTPYYF
jgi:hypothetical protein